MSTKIYITVERGEPLDYIEYRHTALHLIFPDGTECLMHVLGAHGIFNFYNHQNCGPSTRPLYEKSIHVVDIPDSTSPLSIRSVISTTPVKNSPEDRPWNCQNWVADALSRLVLYGYITKSERENAIDEMVTVCLEAKDELEF